MNTTSFLNSVLNAVVNPLIVLGLAVSLVVFVYGIVRFIWKMDEDTERQTGKAAMTWGLVGLLVMVSVFGIINIILSAIGVSGLKLPWQ